MKTQLPDNYIQIDKQSFNQLMELLDYKQIHCTICGKKINSSNFGLIAKDLFSCNNVLCLMEAVEKFEQEKINYNKEKEK